jgi:hypothetical protein
MRRQAMNRLVRSATFLWVWVGLSAPSFAHGQDFPELEERDERERTRNVAVVTGFFGVLAPLANLTENPETFSTDVSISIAFGGEFDYFFKSGFGVGVTGLYAPAKLTISPEDVPIAVPPDLGNAKWTTVTANLMYRVDLKGPAGMVEPYVLVGGGIRNLNVDPIASPEATDSTNGVFDFGFGAFTLVSEHWAIRLDLRGYISPFSVEATDNTRTQFDTTILFGISYGFP